MEKALTASISEPLPKADCDIDWHMSVNLYAQPVAYMAVEILLVPLLWAAVMYFAGKAQMFARLLCLILLSCMVFFIADSTLLSRTAELYTSVGSMPFQLFLKALTENHEIMRSLLLNILLFCPFGAALAYVLPHKIPAVSCVLLAGLIGMILSILIEYFQFRFSLGNAEADDVICNTLGTLIGALSLPVKNMLDRHKNDDIERFSMAEKRYREEHAYSKSRQRRRKKLKRKHGSLLGTVFLVFLVFVLLVGGSFFYLSNRMLSRIEKVEKSEEVWIPPAEATFPVETPELSETGAETETEHPDTITPESVQWTAPVKAVPKPKVKNILLIGQDRRPGEDRARSDVMILCSLNEDTREISLISFMRDMYVPFPGDYEPSRMNHSFAWGGMSLLDQLIEEDFGITIDGNVVIDFNGFISAMNLIAPLNIELKSYEVGYFNACTDWGLHMGVNALNGEQLLAYARLREMGHGDWERTERQRTVLQAAFQKVKNLSLKELTDLANAALPCFSTDMSNTDIMNLIYAVVTNRMTIAGTYRLPIDGSYSEEIIYGMAVLVPDLEANSAYLHRCIYGS